MDSAKGDALEWALALLRAPAERHALRQKPLPAGMDRLLGIAAGTMPHELADAAQAFNEPASRIREAARFYAREVLFFAQADAYRVLGVDPDASDARIKASHRLLQHWLHPDRLDSEDDAVFAARVNVAWNRLRNPERRQAYDALLHKDALAGPLEAGDGARALRAWIPDVDVQPGGWWYRLPVLVLTAACILLVMLALREQDQGPEAWSDAQADEIADADTAAVATPAGVQVAGTIEPPIHHPERIAPDVAVKPEAAAVIAAAAVLVAQPPNQPSTAGEMPPAVIVPVESRTSVKPATVADRLAPPRSDVAATSAAGPVNEPVQPTLATPAPDGLALPSYERTRQAWAAGEQLLSFMAGAGRTSPPIWSSPAIQSSADRLRQELHGAGRVFLSDPQWQIGERSAALTSAYASQGGDAGIGRLTADLVWREGRWLVIGLGIERTQ